MYAVFCTKCKICKYNLSVKKNVNNIRVGDKPPFQYCYRDPKEKPY